MKSKPSTFTCIGAILWLSSIQYYVIQVLSAVSWSKSNGYSWANNTISDLGNTHCGLYGSRLVCSPLHNLMNVSFILLGITMIGGALLLQRYLSTSLMTKIGFICMAVAGAGTIIVGLFPENTVSTFHIIGAVLPFTLGNLGMVLIAIYLNKIPISLRIYTLLSGVIGLVALALFEAGMYLGIGLGGMERFVAYPQSIWMIIFGAYVLVHSFAKVIPEKSKVS